MNKKKVGIVVGAIVAVLTLGGIGVFFLNGASFSGDSGSKVYVEQVSKVTSVDAGMQNRFNGVVESQASHEIEVDSSRTIATIHVAVGDEITVGQKLVTYDTSELELQVAQGNLELESINNEIASCMNQIIYQNNLYQAAEEEEKEYILSEIQNLQNEISQMDFDVKSKQLEIDQYIEEINKSYVNSDVAGIVKEINKTGVNASGDSAPFMKVLQGGDYRVKGSIDEQNIWTLSEGTPVILRSRVDETITWAGTIEKIDTDNPMQGNSDYYYEEGEDLGATKYPFYITLENRDGLLLGQHVYIEMDEGQTEEKTGIWLESSYIVMDEEEAYVWAANSRNRLEKRTVELGEYDETLDQYQILSGLVEEDYICWPMEGLYEGVPTVTNIEEQVWDAGVEDDFMMEDGMMEDGMMEDGMMEDGMMDEDMMDEEDVDAEYSEEEHDEEMSPEVMEEMP